MIKEINDRDFKEEVIKSSDSKPVVVDFWASWCGPCRMLSPVMDQIESEMNGKVKFTKVNVDENPDVSDKFMIASIPTVMIFKSGTPVKTLVGFRPKEAIKSEIQRQI